MGREKIKRIFSKSGRDVLSIYITAGYPELDSTGMLIKELAKNGVDFIEVGMPYSDPLADGETIQRSSKKALGNGMTLDVFFNQIEEVRSEVDVPLVFMGYFNQVLRIGVENFLQRCVASGIDGLIIPDLPPEIYKEKYRKTFEKYNLAISFLITPTTSDERIKLYDEISTGFVYVVSFSSTTGKKGVFSKKQKKYLERINSLNLKNPAVMGFGISDKKSFDFANKYADGAIIGSAFLKAIAGSDDLAGDTAKFIKKIKL